MMIKNRILNLEEKNTNTRKVICFYCDEVTDEELGNIMGAIITLAEPIKDTLYAVHENMKSKALQIT